MENIICEKCGNEFKPKHHKQKQCHDCLWHPCVICGKKINRIGRETCGRECGMIYKSKKSKEKRLEYIGKRFCIICGKEIIDVRLNIKTCGCHECIEKAKKINQNKKGKESICKRCGKEYISYNGKHYCDHCYYDRTCPICGQNIYGGKHETCSKKCAAIFTQQLHGDKYKEYAKVMHTPEAISKASASKKGKPHPWNIGPKYNRRGENHPLRRCGSTIGTRRGIQHSAEYKNIIKEVYKRDDYTCQICLKKGGQLNVHHIRTRDYYPELRMDKNNLVTLCEDCHKHVHKLGGGTHGDTETFSILFKLINEL